jgi:predicted nucleic acid-binding protein
MPEVISNTSCLIALSNIAQLQVLQDLYGIVTITPEVAAEFGETLPPWIRIVPVKDSEKTELISAMLDLGESSTIALGIETSNALLVLDDGKARRFAKNIKLPMTGTLGILVKAHRLGFVLDLAGVVHALQDSGFRISNELVDEIIKHYC